MQRIKRLGILILVLMLAGGCSFAAESDDLQGLIERQYDLLRQSEEEAAVSHEIVHDSQRYVSIVFTLTTQSGNGLHESIRAVTVARDGLYAGQTLNLSQLLGLEQEDASSMASQLVHELVWQIIQAESTDSDYLDGLTKADLETGLQPETDFYLDADGNVVFFIQAGEIAGEVAGVLTFPFAPAELLSAVHE